MDLRFPNAEPSSAEIEALAAVLGDTTLGSAAVDDAARSGWSREHGGVQRAESLRHLLLPALHALVDRVGFVSEGGLGALCRSLDVPPADAYGVASFYSMLPVSEIPTRTVYACEDLACMRFDVARASTDTDSDTRVVRAPCLGLCEQAPATLVVEAGSPPHHEVRSKLPTRGSVPQQGDSSLVLLRRVGLPTTLDSYLASDGYQALRRAFEIGPTAVVDEISASRLVGRGGAAFPTGRKWAAVASQPVTTRYVVANADESEPGTFKDRVILESDPFALIEAMTIAAFATGAQRGYIYLRDEYRTALATLSAAIAAVRDAGYLGQNILGSDLAFDVEVVRGAGAYICGEETAIFNSIEGYRGEPRSKPPFPVEVGLFGMPTLVNNVETFANVLPILLRGGEAFAGSGAGTSTGTKLFCLSGAVTDPGVYEVPFGTTLGEMLQLAGGVAAGRQLKTVLLGGAAGTFIGPDQLSVPLTFEGTRAVGASLGSGVVMVFDDQTEIDVVLRRISAFFRHESCGQCVPCRVGTVRQDEAITRITLGSRREGDLTLLREVGQAMRDASICGLGQTAWNAIESAIDNLGALQQ